MSVLLISYLACPRSDVSACVLVWGDSVLMVAVVWSLGRHWLFPGPGRRHRPMVQER